MTKEQYYEKIKEIRSMLANPDNLKCSCPNTKCEWHGDCKKCVAQHRYFKKHIPSCLQSVFNDKMKEIVQIFEMTATENERIPSEYWEYVRERDRRKKQDWFLVCGKVIAELRGLLHFVFGARLPNMPFVFCLVHTP